MMRLKNEKGIALISVMFFTVVLYALTGIFLVTVINENNAAQKELLISKSFYGSQGAVEKALYQLDVLINDYLMNTIANADPSGVISYANSKVSSGKSIDWLVYAVRDNNVPVLSQNGDDQAEYSDSGMLGNASYSYNIIISEKIDPYDTGTNAWAFPYGYKIIATTTTDGITQTVKLTGDFTVNLMRDNFAKYALFTNDQTSQSGSYIWFTGDTYFNGPVHTNGRFNFALNPSGTFDAEISQQEQLARFRNNGWPVLLDADQNGSTDVPTFNGDFNRDVDAVTMSPGTEESDMIEQATDGGTYGSDGIYIPNDGSTLTGGIYIVGNSDVTLSVDGNNNAVYTITQGTTTKTVTVDQANQETSIWDSDSGSTTTYDGLPDGQNDVGTLIYVDGTIDNLGGTVQEDSHVTIASHSHIVINDDIKYQDYTPAVGDPGDAGYVPPSAVGTDNLLGLVSWDGNVRIGTSAPDDIEVHGTILALEGVFTVDNYNVGSPRGEATLLGGVIQDKYGPFFTFSGATGQVFSGYTRNFVYDQRMQMGEAPPYFPSLNTFIAFSNDIVDQLVWQEGE